MTELRQRTEAEYRAQIQTLRDEAQRLDNSKISSASEAREVAKTIAALTLRADAMERAIITDGTVRGEWQQAAVEREQERTANRMRAAIEMDKRINPQKFIDGDVAREFLKNSVDISFAGMDDANKVEFIAQLLGGQGNKDVDGNRFLSRNGVRATLHNDDSGSYVSFVSSGGE